MCDRKVSLFCRLNERAAELHALMSRHINRDILRISWMIGRGWPGDDAGCAQGIYTSVSIQHHPGGIRWLESYRRYNTPGSAGSLTDAGFLDRGTPLLFAQTLLNEHLRRQGHPELILPRQACQLDDFALCLIHLGGGDRRGNTISA